MQLHSDDFLQELQSVNLSCLPWMISSVIKLQLHRKKKNKVCSIKTYKLCIPLGIGALNNSCPGMKGIWMILDKCKCYGIWLSKHAVFCTHAICWEWVTAAKYIVLLTLYTAMINWSRQGIGESTTIQHSLMVWQNTQAANFPLLPWFPCLLAIKPSPDVIFRKPLNSRGGNSSAPQPHWTGAVQDESWKLSSKVWEGGRTVWVAQQFVVHRSWTQ